jgi:hypothetical protein
VLLHEVPIEKVNNGRGGPGGALPACVFTIRRSLVGLGAMPYPCTCERTANGRFGSEFTVAPA